MDDLMDLMTPWCVHTVATLGIARHLDAGSAEIGPLATAAGCDERALHNVLGHLATKGVFTEPSPGRFALTDAGRSLLGMPFLDLNGIGGRFAGAWETIPAYVRTGRPAYAEKFGRPFWDDLAADRTLAASFDALMGGRLGADAPRIAAAYPWGTLGHVVDVGGGNATLLIAILRAHDGLRGTVVDLAGPVAGAQQAIAAAGLADRAGAQAGSFFDALPAGAGGYLLSGVLHDWDDEDAARILQRCADAAADTGRVLVVEDAAGGALDTAGDLRMLCYVRGRDRTLEQLAELAKSTGLQVGSVVPAGSRSIVELRPSR
jgi:hypothetical protein